MSPRLTLCGLLLLVLLLTAAESPVLPPAYNPMWVYNARLALFDEALELPKSQRGLHTQHSYLHYLGHTYLLQARYYNAQGLLDSCLTYDLEQTGDSLTSYLHIRAHYHSQHHRHFLTSTVQERWTYYEPATPTTQRYVGRYTRYVAGNPPPAEPLLAEPLVPRTGTFCQSSRTDTATWHWHHEAATNEVVFSYAAQPKRGRDGYVGWQAILHVAKQELTCTIGTNGGSWEYVRRYLTGGPAYVEQCKSSSIMVGTGGGSLNSNVYTRTTAWQAGLCQREHFVITDVLLAGAHPEFDVVHTYSFYQASRRGR